MLIDIDDLKRQLNSTVASEVVEAEKEAIALLEQGNLEAADLLISAYAEGAPLIRPDRIKEFKYTKMAADLGSDFCRYWLAKLQHGSKDYAGAIENATRAHAMGIPYAATLLGKMMLAGEGQPAKPLDALQILSDSVDKDENTDAALLIAQVYMEEKVVPRDAQGAYDILQRLAHVFERSAPALRADYLAFKAESIRLGAAPGPGESYEQLISQAADLGNESAVVARGKLQTDVLDRKLKAEWDAISQFHAMAKKWKMFLKIGVLTGAVTQNRSSLYNNSDGRVGVTNSRVRVLTLVTASGQEFTVTAHRKGTVATGRRYAVVYVGPHDSDEGVQAMVYDLESGDVIKTLGHPLETYKGGTFQVLLSAAGVVMWLVLSLWLVVMVMDHFSFGSFLLWLVSATVALKLLMWPLTGYKKALAAARAFFETHRDKMM
jgi:TPR repeat protein